MRLNKYLSDAGVCSRREADKLIEAGKITVNGDAALMGMQVNPEDSSLDIRIEGRPISVETKKVILALNKPVGIECTTDRDNPDNIVDFVNYPMRVYPVGRLDKNSEGLILLTNDGSLVNKILKGSSFKEKEYVVTVDKKITDDFIEKMSSGVEILDTVTRPCKVTKISNNTFNIVLTQGLNRQIRRMCKALGYNVQKLKRTRIMKLKMGNLQKGSYREVTAEEIGIKLD